MSNQLVPTLPQKGIMKLVDANHLSAVEHALAMNDLSKLTTEQRISYYNAVCESVGLNPLTQPFAYIVLDGRLTLYARKECSEQLRKLNSVSTQIISKQETDDFYEVHVRAGDRTGRVEEDFASLYLFDKYNKRLTGTNLANAKMKCVTKAKRRVTLAISGLGVLDESELDSIDQSKIKVTENPQLPNAFGPKDVNPEEQIDPIPDAAEESQEIKNESGPGAYVAKFGKYKNQRVDEIPREHLKSYIYGYLEKGSKEKGKPLDGDVLEFFNNGDAYLKAAADLTN